jgi:quercetin dioxygenase-like cupin family protein
VGLLLHLILALSAVEGTLAAPLYKVEIDNPWVHVVRETLAPHETSVPHTHTNPTVTVYVTPTREHHAGDVIWREAGPHAEENISERPAEFVVIELKPDEPPSPPVSLDPVTLDPKYHIVVLENSRVRALRTILEPGIKSPLHEHPHYVVVYLTELHTTMTLGDGREVDNPRHPGETAWRDYMKHSTLNVGKKTAVEIQVELK